MVPLPWNWERGKHGGFAPNAAVSLSPADTASPGDNTRMSWYLDQSSGGHRAGSTDVSALYKVVLYCNGE